MYFLKIKGTLIYENNVPGNSYKIFLMKVIIMCSIPEMPVFLVTAIYKHCKMRL